MNTINWNTYKFHPSGLKNLMVKSRKKDEDLSETAKAYLRDLWIKEVYGREKIDMIGNKYTRKGTACETDTIELYERVSGKKFFKNQKTLHNDFIVGTPDIVKSELIDIKTSWDIWTFSSVTRDQCEKDYYIQVLCYMWLTGHKNATVVYGLVNTPEEMIADELYKLSFRLSPDEDTEKYRQNYAYDDISENERIKEFEFVYSEENIEVIKSKIMVGREYLKSMCL